MTKKQVQKLLSSPLVNNQLIKVLNSAKEDMMIFGSAVLEVYWDHNLDRVCYENIPYSKLLMKDQYDEILRARGKNNRSSKNRKQKAQTRK